MLETNKKEKIIETIIGILLLIPIDIVVFMLLMKLLYQTKNPPDNLIDIILAITMYLPIFIGIILSFVKYKTKLPKILGSFALLFLVASGFLFGYYLSAPNFNGHKLTFLTSWIFSVFIGRIFLFFSYFKAINMKKAIILFIIYVGIIAFWLF